MKSKIKPVVREEDKHIYGEYRGMTEIEDFHVLKIKIIKRPDGK